MCKRISLAAIAAYDNEHGSRSNMESAVCCEAGGMDVWCFVVRLSPIEWHVTMLPDKEAQCYMAEHNDWKDYPPPTVIVSHCDD